MIRIGNGEFLFRLNKDNLLLVVISWETYTFFLVIKGKSYLKSGYQPWISRKHKEEEGKRIIEKMNRMVNSEVDV